MDKLKIIGGKKLFGSIKISSAKNAVLPIMSASILIDGVAVIEDAPNFSDCRVMQELLLSFGAKISKQEDKLIINSTNINSGVLSSELAQKIRGSFFTFGSILARLKKAVFAYPGGCNIGARPIDMHLKAFKELGVKVTEKHGYIHAELTKFSGGKVVLDFPSVGVTENVMLLACTLEGVTTICNPAKEPEVVDLQNFLVASGAKIYGAGTDKIVIIGTNKLLHSCTYKAIGDRIIAGTYLTACACCGGEIFLKNINHAYLQDVLEKLTSAGANVSVSDEGVTISSNKKLHAIPIIQTNPYPYFPTDMQPQITVMQSIAQGNSVVIENIFESRLGYVSQLVKMGAKIKVKNNMAFINGGQNLFGAEVQSPDLRAGAGLVIAGLCASGYTTISGVPYIDRGYDKIEYDLQNLGADITRVM